MYQIKYLLLTVCLFALPYILQAQAVQTKEPNYRDAVLDRQFGIVAEIKAKPAGTEGTYYLSENWHPGNIYLTSTDTLRGYLLKYDIESNSLEIKTAQDIKVLRGEKIAMFEWENTENAGKSVFVNGSFFTNAGTKLTGFYAVLFSGKAQLLSKTFLERMKSNYNVALDVGSRSEKIIKKEKFYIGRDQHAYEITPKKEKLSVAFGNHTDEVIAFARKNSLKFNKKEDLIKIAEFYNTIN